MDELSAFGVPLTHDGVAFPTQMLFVERVSDITEDGWDYIGETRYLNWVIIPTRSQSNADSEDWAEQERPLVVQQD